MTHTSSRLIAWLRNPYWFVYCIFLMLTAQIQNVMAQQASPDLGVIKIWDSQMRSIFGSVLRFDADHHSRIQALLAKGPVHHPKSKRNSYQFEDMIKVAGQEFRIVYDLHGSQTSLSIAEQLLPYLARQGYETLYHCSAEKCGAAVGWQLLLAPLTVGSSETQAYALLGRYPLGSGYQEYLQLYWNQTGCCPRLSIGVIQSVQLDSIVDETKFSQNQGLSMTVAYFESGSAKLSPYSQAFLRRLAGRFSTKDNPCQVKVTGYSDPAGNASINQQLSIDRASEVRNLLVKSGWDPTHYLFELAIGTVDTALSGSPPHALWRKTDINLDCRKST